MIPFTPGKTVTITATVTTGAVALGVPSTEADRIPYTVRVVSAPSIVGTTYGPAYINFGTSASVAAAVATATATAGRMPILPGAIEVFTIPPNYTHVAAITASGTAVLWFTLGSGV